MEDKKYPELKALLKEDAASRDYFRTLPEYVRSQIAQRGDSVQSLSSLKDYAENLTRGDG